MMSSCMMICRGSPRILKAKSLEAFIPAEKIEIFEK